MLDILVFALGRLLTRRFWFLVAATFAGVLAMWVRSNMRQVIFEQAAATVGKRFN